MHISRLVLLPALRFVFVLVLIAFVLLIGVVLHLLFSFLLCGTMCVLFLPSSFPAFVFLFSLLFELQ